jgi:hypothetical protein
VAEAFLVTGFSQIDQIGASGNLVAAMRVVFELTDGSGEGNVTVPLVEGWEIEAERLIRARVAEIQKLQAL